MPGIIIPPTWGDIYMYNCICISTHTFSSFRVVQDLSYENPYRWYTCYSRAQDCNCWSHQCLFFHWELTFHAFTEIHLLATKSENLGPASSKVFSWKLSPVFSIKICVTCLGLVLGFSSIDFSDTPLYTWQMITRNNNHKQHWLHRGRRWREAVLTRL